MGTPLVRWSTRVRINTWRLSENKMPIAENLYMVNNKDM